MKPPRKVRIGYSFTMPFQIHPLKEFIVRPALPPALSRLGELAYNLLWSWDHSVRAVFRRLDEKLWKSCGSNPVLMLGRIPQATLERMANDPRYLSVYKNACERLDHYLTLQPDPDDGKLIAYFSMEYGLVDCMPIYSGGLGVLSGDHLKASSESGFPLVAVGLLYQKGYLQQYLNADGLQLERNPVNDFYTLPVREVTTADSKELIIHVSLGSIQVGVKVWKMDVGRVTLFLLDTNIPENASPEDRAITDQLYGGDIHKRIRQEVVLGIGGIRALRALGLSPTVYHMNEGHSAFLAIERIRLLMQEHGLRFEEALEASRHNNIFTTHTPVPAGIDLFDAGNLHTYLGPYCNQNGIDFQKFLSLGRRNPFDQGESFSMAICAFQASAYRNAVSRLHREVSQEMWQDLWPGLPVWEVPISYVTNGVHLRGWLNGELAQVYDQYLVPDWRERHQEPKTWEFVNEIPDTELWDAHRRRKRILTGFVRERSLASARQRSAPPAELTRMSELLDADALTIGFARRFATYKRATLLFRDPERLKKILTNPNRPVQVVIAGKAHPKDIPGKTLISQIVQMSRDPELRGRIVFLEDYGMQVAREMVQGVDIWLNNPRRGEEACGTSGMKAGINGVLNLSILDGWFDEGYEESGGWAIGGREPYDPAQDDTHARTIYSLLENEIVPLYYDRGENGVPAGWVRRMRESIRSISMGFSAWRMVNEYMAQFYEPAHSAGARMQLDDFKIARDLTRWNERVSSVWNDVKFLEAGPGPEATVQTGVPLSIRAVLHLAGLEPGDVRVEAVVGRIATSGMLEDTTVMTLSPGQKMENGFEFFREFTPEITGRLGYALRVTANHYHDPLTRPCRSPLRWAESDVLK